MRIITTYYLPGLKKKGEIINTIADPVKILANSGYWLINPFTKKRTKEFVLHFNGDGIKYTTNPEDKSEILLESISSLIIGKK